jgi:biotin carboxylase
MVTILCLATYLKGDAFIRECQVQGADVVLLTNDRLADAAWPREAIREIQTIPRNASDAEIRRVVAGVARRIHIDRVTALDDFDVETGAMLREFLQLPGFGRTVANRFRDKLAMRTAARRLGIAVPEFTAVFNDQDVARWTERVPLPWILKPRSSAAATGLRKVTGRDELWPALEAAGADRDGCLLEQFVSGDVYHVDSIVTGGAVVFSVASQYGRPPMAIAHEGGVFVTRRLRDHSPDAAPLLAANRALLTGFGLHDGVSHTEFIAGPQGVLFLETSARVGGAYIVDVVEAATGVHLWREWARLEIAGGADGYTVPAGRGDAAGIALCLARQEHPDLSSYTDPEIVRRIDRRHHAGLIVSSSDFGRIESLLEDYTRRFSIDFLATMPVPDRPVE